MKYIKFLVIFIFISGCGFSPIYKGITNVDFGISLKDINGDRDLNNFLNSNLNKYLKVNSDKIFDISINSRYNKTVISKDVTGNATDYELSVTVHFDITSKDLNKKIVLSEKVTTKKMDNNFDQENYERNTKKNFANSITNKLIRRLSQFK